MFLRRGVGESSLLPGRFGVVIGVSCIGDVAGTDGEEVVFDGSGAIESPVIVCDPG
jgi:hypothetical protein